MRIFYFPFHRTTFELFVERTQKARFTTPSLINENFYLSYTLFFYAAKDI